MKLKIDIRTVSKTPIARYG